MTDDLHVQLRAAIEQRLATARAATPGPWVHVDYADPSGQPMTTDGRKSTYMGCGSVITMGEDGMGGDIAAPNGDLYPRSGYSPFEDMAFIAANGPDVIVRHCEADLRRLERHTQTSSGCCGNCCNSITHAKYGSTTSPWPCDDIRELAAAYALDIPGSQT